MSFGQIARLVAILCFAAITASAQDNTTPAVPSLTANTIQIYAPADVTSGTAYIIPESFADTPMCKSRIVSAEVKDTVAEIVRRSDCMPRAIPAIVCDGCDWTVRKVWKEVYRIQGDKLVFQKRIDGKIIPAQGERIEWPKALETSAVTLTFSGSGSGVLHASSTGDLTIGGNSPNKPLPPKKKHRHHRRTQ